VTALLKEGKTWRQIQAMVPVSKATLAKLSRSLKDRQNQ
jgi:uncharacterized protein YerC